MSRRRIGVSAIASFLLKRLGQALLVIWVLSLIGFAIQDNLGDPLRELVGQVVTEEERERLREQLGLNEPFLERYTRFLGHAVTGDLGTSYFFKEPALEVILAKFPATFELVLVASLLIIALSVPLGIFCAVRPESIFARIIMGVSIVGISVPVFLTGIVLISVFAVGLGWLPAFGRGETVRIGFWESGLLTLDGLRHVILPAVTLASIMLPLFIRLVRSEMMEVLGEDFMRTARAKGLPPRQVLIAHGLRNAALPLVTVGGLQIGTMVAFTILTETVFQWPGMGFMFLEAVTRADTPLIIAYIMVVGLIFVATNTIVDLIYLAVDPRVSLSGLGQ